MIQKKWVKDIVRKPRQLEMWEPAKAAWYWFWREGDKMAYLVYTSANGAEQLRAIGYQLEEREEPVNGQEKAKAT